MGELVFGLVLLAVAFFLRLGAATVRGETTGGRSIGGILPPIMGLGPSRPQSTAMPPLKAM